MSTINSDEFQTMLLQLRNSFLEDIPEKLELLENLLLSIEKKEGGIEEFNELFRGVHSLKGSGGTHGLQIITTICHQLEDLLSTTDAGNRFTPGIINTSLKYIDLLRTAKEKIQSGSHNFTDIEEQLNVLRLQFTQKQFTVLIVDNSKLCKRSINCNLFSGA
jgi:chemotaxis protein histidine kinase CheA